MSITLKNVRYLSKMKFKYKYKDVITTYLDILTSRQLT